MSDLSSYFFRFLKDGSQVPKDSSLWPEAWKIIEFKKYERNLRHHTLQKDIDDDYFSVSLRQALLQRKSSFAFEKPLTSHELLLVLSEATKERSDLNRRPYPSAGALYPLEIYYISFSNETDLECGLYHYSQVEKKLSYIKKTSGLEVKKFFGDYQEWRLGVKGFIVITYLPRRNITKYRDFALRATSMEVGALLQTISLIAGATLLATRMIGSWENTLLDEYLEIDGINELSLAILAIGKE